MKQFSVLVSIVLLVTLCVPTQAAYESFDHKTVSAAACVLYDPLTGRFLYEKDADTKRPIASTTKLMTALTVLACTDPADTVTVTAEAVHVEGSRIYIKPERQGKKIAQNAIRLCEKEFPDAKALSVETLLYGLLLESGNDAALALALHCDGSVEAFAERMNAEAEKLGLSSTHFVNPHGLPAKDHFSTAREMALVTAAACDHPLLQTIMSTRTVTKEGYRFTHHNKLLWRLDVADGGKTGFTTAAGRCLCSSASYEGRRLICVTLNAPDDWNDHEMLYRTAFESLDSYSFLEPGAAAAAIPVAGSFGISAAVSPKDLLNCTLFKEEAENISVRLLLPQHVYAPVSAGKQAGTAEICLGGHILASVPLFFTHDIVLPPRNQSLLSRLFG